MDEKEIRLRLIEAAAKCGNQHVDGHAAGVVEAASKWFAWVCLQPTAAKDPRDVLGLPPARGKLPQR